MGNNVDKVKSIIKVTMYYEFSLSVEQGDDVPAALLDAFGDYGDGYDPIDTDKYPNTVELVSYEIENPATLMIKEIASLEQIKKNALSSAEHYNCLAKNLEEEIIQKRKTLIELEKTEKE